MKIINTIILFTLLSAPVAAQDYLKIDPIDPTAASIAKYGDYPVNYSKGLPNITIPLYQIKSGGLTQDITLSYHGGGIKVSEDASWVGLGWDLFYGGAITRQVYGRPDEDEDFFNIPDANEVEDYMYGNTDLRDPDHDLWSSGLITFMPDVYHFNVSGYSGKYVLNNNKEPVQIPHSSLKIDRHRTIYSPTGTKYTFAETDRTTIKPLENGVPEHNTTWHISKITSANNNDTIRYEYQEDGYISNKTMSYSEGYKTDTDTNFTTLDRVVTTKIGLKPSSSYQMVKSVKPQYIYFNNGRVTFGLSSRNDIYFNLPGPQKPIVKKLDHIIIEKKVQDGTYLPIKRIEFIYSYFNSSGVNNTNYDNASPFNLKLKLNAIVQISYGQDPHEEETLFSYYEDHPIAKKNSYSTDFWGYYNGRGNSSPILERYINVTLSPEKIGGAIKTPNESYMKTGSLKSITYPTKGKTEFDWEINRYGGESPFIEMQDYEFVSLGFPYNPDIYCGNDPVPTPDGELNIEKQSIIITPHVPQSIFVEYYKYRSELYSNQHNKYDSGTLTIKNLTTNTEISLDNSYAAKGTYRNRSLNLTPGHKYVFSISRNCYNVQLGFTFKYNKYNPNLDKYNYPIGGLRISKISNYDALNNLLVQKQFKYNVPENEQSSGYLTTRQTADFTTGSMTIKRAYLPPIVADGLPICYNHETRTYLFHSSPVTGISPSNLTYQYVQEFQLDKNGNYEGHIEYEFDVCDDTYIGEEFPLISNEWKRGQLVRKTVYKGNGANRMKVLETLNNYMVDDAFNRKAIGFKMTKPLNLESHCGLTDLDYYMSDIYSCSNYEYVSKWSKLISTSTTEYLDNNKEIVSNTNYEYNNLDNCMVTTETQILQNGLKRITKNKYPTDYADGILNSMKELHMIAPVIEQQNWLDKNGNINLLGGFINEYTINEHQHTVLDKIHVLELDEPISVLNDGFSNGKYSILKPTSNNAQYVEKANYKYNVIGRPIEEVKPEGQNKAFIWGYNNNYPVARIENATYQQAVAYLNSTDWKTLNNPQSDEALRNVLAKIRNGFLNDRKEAYISIYTYEALKGITSKTDPNGKTVYYNYDGSGRLISITDHEFNVLKSVEYNYKN